MFRDKNFEQIINQTEILRVPHYKLNTFGVTKINYYLLTIPEVNRVRTREGVISSERPKIITSCMLSEIFEGFNEETERYAQAIFEKLGSDLRILEYKFKNKLENIQTDFGNINLIYSRISKRVEEEQITIIKGVEKYWQVSLMKFIMEFTLKSFYANVTELEEKGFFLPLQERELIQKKAEIEQLFKEIERDKSKINLLGKKLSQYKLFEEYQDRFFELFRKK